MPGAFVYVFPCDGIGFGIISYTVIKVCRGKVKEVPVLMYVLSVLFVAMYVLSAL